MNLKIALLITNDAVMQISFGVLELKAAQA